MQAWFNMKYRCLNLDHPLWKHYDGRGITICERWLDETPVRIGKRGPPTTQGFLNFYEDMQETWFLGVGKNAASLSRIDNDGSYCLKNCIWKTMGQNSQEMSIRTNKKRVIEKEHNFQKKGMVNALDIYTGECHQISKEEYWLGKGVRYFKPNSNAAKEFKIILFSQNTGVKGYRQVREEKI